MVLDLVILLEWCGEEMKSFYDRRMISNHFSRKRIWENEEATSVFYWELFSFYGN